MLGVDHCSISLAVLAFPQTQPRTFPGVQGQSQGQHQAWLWVRLAGGASSSTGCCPGAAAMVHLPRNTPAVSCSSMELKQALFTLTAAFKGKIQVDFEAVEFTDQFGFLQVCGVELWASE